MPNILFKPNGFIGDRLLTTSAMTVAKRYYPDVKTYIFLDQSFWYMDDVLMSTGIVDGIVRSEEHISSIQWDSMFTMPACRFDTNPVQVYCESFIENLPANSDLTPSFIDVNKLPVRDLFSTPTIPYITYQVDWENKTCLNVRKIIDTLVQNGIHCVPVGRIGAQANDLHALHKDFKLQEDERRYNLNETIKLISGATLHLCMNGGTAMFAGYVKTRCAMTMDWFYIRHNEQKMDSYSYINWIKQTPKDMSGDNKHHMFNPLITESQLIEETLKLVDSELHPRLQLPPNLIEHPELLDRLINNYNSPIFKG
jgi:hypothetical protein